MSINGIPVDGLIEVFLGDKYYKPILRTVDEKSLPVNFISFASDTSSRAMFFYDCREAEDDHSEEPEHVTVHPLLASRPIDDINGFDYYYLFVRSIAGYSILFYHFQS